MIQVKEFPDKQFETKEELFKALKENKKTLIAAKKSEVKTKANSLLIGFYDPKEKTVKGIPDMDKDFIYPIISNTNYLDSHKDVHVDGSMTKTAKEQNRKVYYVADHKLEVDSVIATPKNVEVQLMTLTWKDIGKNYEGTTEALVYKIPKSEIMHEKFLAMVNKNEPLQNSIRMEYVTLDLAINSQDKEYEDEYKVYSEIAPKVVNKEALDESMFFWAVKELKLKLEGSAVLFGSNDATPIEYKDEAVTDTSDKNEPPASTQSKIFNPNLF